MTQDNQNAKSPNSTKLDERLERVETLLGQLVDKERSQDPDGRQLSSSPDDGGRSELLPQLSSNASNVHESGPLLSLFDNSVVSAVASLEIFRDAHCDAIRLVGARSPSRLNRRRRRMR